MRRDGGKGRTSPQALAAAEAAAWAPRLADLERARQACNRVDRIRERILRRFPVLPLLPESAAPEHREAVQRAWDRHDARTQRYARLFWAVEAAGRRVMDQVARRRDEQDASGTLPFGDDACAKLRELRDFLAVATAVPTTPNEYRRLLLEHYVPEYNRISTTDRCCVECGTLFAIGRDGRSRSSKYCTDACAARPRNRDRVRTSKADRVQLQVKHHMANCISCKTGRRPCLHMEALLAGEGHIRSRSRRLKE